MKSITRTKNLIIALFLGIVCLVAGLFFFAKKKPDVITTKADTVEQIEDFKLTNVTLPKDPDNYEMKLTFQFPIDMYLDLKSEGNNYIIIFRQDVNNSDKSDSWWCGTRYPDDLYSELLIEMEDPVVESMEDIPDYVTGHIEIPMYWHPGFGLPDNPDIPYEHEYIFDIQMKYTFGWIKLIDGVEGYRVAGTGLESTFSIAEKAQEILDTEGDILTTEQVMWMNRLAGYKTSADSFTVNFEYKVVAEYGRIETVTEQYQAESLYVGRGNLVYTTIMNLKGSPALSSFNAVYKNPDGTPEKIILQADGYTYTYDNESETALLAIKYREFDYKSFAIRLQDNDLENNTNLYYYIWATSITEKRGKITIHFNYADIVKKCFNDLRWIFELSSENFTIVNNSQSIWDIRLSATECTVGFFNQYEEELKDISILAVAEIIPDYLCDVQVKYSSLAFENSTILETQEVEIKSMMYSSYIQLSNFSIFKESVMYERVTSALQVAELGKQEYFIPYNLEAKKNADGSFTLQMLYNYNTLLQITDETNGKVHFIACTANSLTYNINLLGIAATTGWRIKSLSSEDPSVTINFDEANTSNLSVTVNTSTKEKKIIPIVVNYSDVWNLNIVYMRTYKDTPFALRTEETKQIKVSEYNPKAMTLTDIKGLLGRTDAMKVCGISIPDEKVKTELTSDSTYTATLSYGVCSINQIDYNGVIQELKIPLTSFVDWAKTFGDDELTILYLNTEEKQYFNHSNEIERENLYGFFSMAVFKEQVSDFNYYFKENTGKGNMVVFENREVKGSKLYQFFGGISTSGTALSAYGHVGMVYCEILNDDNHISHSYFFYMDATEGYISNSGAGDKNDTDTGAQNKGEEISSDLKELTGGLTDNLSKTMKMFRILTAAVLGIALAGGIAFGVIWLIKYYKKKE